MQLHKPEGTPLSAAQAMALTERRAARGEGGADNQSFAEGGVYPTGWGVGMRAKKGLCTSNGPFGCGVESRDAYHPTGQKERSWGSGTQKFVYQKRPNQIFPIVDFFSTMVTLVRWGGRSSYGCWPFQFKVWEGG